MCIISLWRRGVGLGWRRCLAEARHVPPCVVASRLPLGKSNFRGARTTTTTTMTMTTVSRRRCGPAGVVGGQACRAADGIEQRKRTIHDTLCDATRRDVAQKMLCRMVGVIAQRDSRREVARRSAGRFRLRSALLRACVRACGTVCNCV